MGWVGKITLLIQSAISFPLYRTWETDFELSDWKKNTTSTFFQDVFQECWPSNFSFSKQSKVMWMDRPYGQFGRPRLFAKMWPLRRVQWYRNELYYCAKTPTLLEETSIAPSEGWITINYQDSHLMTTTNYWSDLATYWKEHGWEMNGNLVIGCLG